MALFVSAYRNMWSTTRKPGLFHEIGTDIFGISSKLPIGREEI